MLMSSDGRSIGAVSGGCVEKEIWRQAQEVFTNRRPKMMTYDGRYRLGCEGILHILIEPFEPDELFVEAFWRAIRKREKIGCRAYYTKDDDTATGMGSCFRFNEEFHGLSSGCKTKPDLEVLEQELAPCHRMLIIGAEHDAVQLSSYASMTGWEVSIVVSPSEEKKIENFPGANELLAVAPEDFDVSVIDTETSVILMTHSYVKDLAFLMALRSKNLSYLGLLGPAARREKLVNDLLERCPDTNPDFIENIHGPAGLDIGAETPQEIAISVISEILSVYRRTRPHSLREKQGAIHQL